MNPLVSILIPAHNVEPWIAETLRSALAQTWPLKEIIVADDGSTDGTRNVVRQFASEGVRLVSQDKQGASAARNTAFSACQGEYIQWLDADDLMSPDKIARQMSCLQGDSTRRMLASSAWGYFNYRISAARFTPSELWCDLSPTEWLIRKIGLNLHMQTATWLTSRELTEAAGPWNTQLTTDDDGEYFCRVLLKSGGVRFVPDARVYYRLAASNRLSQMGRSDAKNESQFASMKLHISYLRGLEDSERVRAACLYYLQIWLISFYPERPDIVEAARCLALELGGALQSPRLTWKYRWIQELFGWSLAKRAQVLLPRIKTAAWRAYDKRMSLAGTSLLTRAIRSNE